MKIRVIKKGNATVKTNNICPWVVDVPPETNKK